MLLFKIIIPLFKYLNVNIWNLIFYLPNSDPDKPRQGSNWDACVYSWIVVGNLAAETKKINK